MDYQLILSPNIGFASADFVAVWNVTTECRAVAEAHLLPHDIVVLKRREDLDIREHTIEKLVKEVLRRVLTVDNKAR